MRHGELFLRRHAAAGGLFAVAEGGVEENNVIRDHALDLPGESLLTSTVSLI
jgi:hypothetical protein